MSIYNDERVKSIQSNNGLKKSDKKRRSSSGCFAPFKSPAAKKSKPISPSLAAHTINKVQLAQEVLLLHKQIEEKDKEIDELNEHYSESELQEHIDNLHEYNEVKDIAQMVIGKLAEQRSTTTKELYSYFDLDLED